MLLPCMETWQLQRYFLMCFIFACALQHWESLVYIVPSLWQSLECQISEIFEWWLDIFHLSSTTNKLFYALASFCTFLNMTAFWEQKIMTGDMPPQVPLWFLLQCIYHGSLLDCEWQVLLTAYLCVGRILTAFLVWWLFAWRSRQITLLLILAYIRGEVAVGFGRLTSDYNEGHGSAHFKFLQNSLNSLVAAGAPHKSSGCENSIRSNFCLCSCSDVAAVFNNKGVVCISRSTSMHVWHHSAEVVDLR